LQLLVQHQSTSKGSVGVTLLGQWGGRTVANKTGLGAYLVEGKILNSGVV